MSVEEQLRDYRATLDTATEDTASRPNRTVAMRRIRPVRSLAIAAVAVAAAVAIAFAAVGVTHRGSTSPVGVATSTTPTSGSSPITAGPPRVPDVLGMKSADAAMVMTQAGFTVEVVDVACTGAPRGSVTAQHPPAGTRAHAGDTATLTVCTGPPSAATAVLPVVVCPTQTGTLPSPSDPHAPTSVTVPTPSFAAPKLSGYSDLRGLLPTTAPEGWTCKALDSTDGGTALGITPPGATPRDSWGVGGKVTQPPTDGVFAQSDGACQGCVYGDVCSIVPGVAADFPSFASVSGFCRTAPAGEHVTPLGNNLYRIDDPAGALGPDAAHSVLRYTPKTATTDASVIRETCILPASQASVCDALLNEFLALNPAGS
jgi:hypothetical protein